jgi:hypothetical protein
MAGFTSGTAGKMTEAQKEAARAANFELAKVFELKPKTRGEGVLFDNEARSDGSPLTDADPIQTGVLNFEMVTPDGEVLPVEVPLSAFEKHAEGTGTRYLSLSMGVKDGVHFYGKLFNNMGSATRKDSSPDYSGHIKVLPVRVGGDGVLEKHPPEAWDAAPQLMVWGRRERAAGTNKPYIKLAVRPQRDATPVADNEIKF